MDKLKVDYLKVEEMGKINEIVDWINKHEKQAEPTMRQAVQLMIEDMRRGKNATKAKATNSTGTIT